MKKLLVICLCIIMLFCSFSVGVNAQQSDSSEVFNEIFGNSFEKEDITAFISGLSEASIFQLMQTGCFSPLDNWSCFFSADKPVSEDSMTMLVYKNPEMFGILPNEYVFFNYYNIYQLDYDWNECNIFGNYVLPVGYDLEIEVTDAYKMLVEDMTNLERLYFQASVLYGLLENEYINDAFMPLLMRTEDDCQLVANDVNGDFEFSAKDSLVLKKYLAGCDVLVLYQVADANKDSFVDGKDSLLIKRLLAGN